MRAGGETLGGARPLLLVFMQVIQAADLSLLAAALGFLRDVFLCVHERGYDPAVVLHVQRSLAATFHRVLTDPFDLYRRDVCVEWYHRMVKELSPNAQMLGPAEPPQIFASKSRL